MAIHPTDQSKSFYQALQELPDLDLRDQRGKIHDLPLILLGLTLSLLRGKDGNLSSIHRGMQHTHQTLCSFLDIEEGLVVSRAQLPLVLQKVNLVVFEALLFSYYGVKLSAQQKQWFAADGKELRGSIAKGNTRGEAVVQIVDHAERSVAAQGFYNGRKESEKPTLRRLLAENNLLEQCISMDALHLDPTTLAPIAQAGGWFLIALKGNQAELSTELQRVAQYLPVEQEGQTVEKGHGRIDQRNYRAYDVKEQYFDARWNECSFTTLVEVNRTRLILKTGQRSQETAWFLSNAPFEHGEQLFVAVRQHWTVETSNHIRDVTLKEDQLRTAKNFLSRVLAGFRTLAIKLLHQCKPKNMVAQIEHFQDDFGYLLASLRQIGFL